MKIFFEEIKEKTVHFSQERPRSFEDSRGFSVSKAYFPKEIANSSLSNAHFHEESIIPSLSEAYFSEEIEISWQTEADIFGKL